MDPVKVKGITDWPPPETLRQLRSFLGFCNFYHRFIWKYADLSQPLNELLSKTTNWNWTTERDEAFEALKKRFTSSPVLILPNQSKPFEIEADASLFATGAVLYQNDINGDQHPSTFLSQTLAPAE